MAVLCKCTCASSHPAVIGACSSYARASEDGGLAICEGCRRALTIGKAPMDYPSAWDFCAATELGEHDQRCSYRRTGAMLLCDCHVLDDEYARRRAQTPDG